MKSLLFCLVLGSCLAPAWLVGQPDLELARAMESKGDYDNALHYYLTFQYYRPRHKEARAAITRVYQQLATKERALLEFGSARQEPSFSSFEQLKSWEDSLLAVKPRSTRYATLMRSRGFLADTTGLNATTLPQANSRIRAIASKWRLILADDQWVKASAEYHQQRHAAAYQYAVAALNIRPELIREPAFDSLMLSIRQNAIKVAILPFEDLTYQGNGLHRQVFVRVLEAIDTLDVPVLQVMDGSYLGISSESGPAIEGNQLSPKLAEARARGATFALVGRLTRAINGAVDATASNQTAYLSRQTNGSTVADIPVNFQEVTRTRELQVDIECELVDLAEGRVVARQTFPYSSLEQLSYSTYSGGNPSDLNFYKTREYTPDSKWAAVGNLASTILEATDGAARRRSFSAPRDFGPIATLHEQAREHLTRQVVSFYLLAARPVE